MLYKCRGVIPPAPEATEGDLPLMKDMVPELCEVSNSTCKYEIMLLIFRITRKYCQTSHH
jgi:hypothetical protein